MGFYCKTNDHTKSSFCACAVFLLFTCVPLGSPATEPLCMEREPSLYRFLVSQKAFWLEMRYSHGGTIKLVIHLGVLHYIL